jgi:DNA-binding transcriptional LysR family regulator
MPIVSELAILFNAQYPNSTIRLMELNPEDIHRAFEEFRLHIAVMYLNDKIPRQARVHKLYSEEYSFAIRKDALPASYKCISWDEASRYSLCLLSLETSGTNSRLIDLLSQGNHDSPRLETNSLTALQAHVRSGAWAALLPTQLAKDMQAAGAFVTIPLPPSRNALSVGIVVPGPEIAVPLAEAFFKMAVSFKPISPRPRSRALPR